MNGLKSNLIHSQKNLCPPFHHTMKWLEKKEKKLRFEFFTKIISTNFKNLFKTKIKKISIIFLQQI
jgi:hypothetical protein